MHVPLIKKMRFSKNTKVLITNFFSLSILKGFEFLIPLITLPYLVRTLGIENFGLVNFALAFAMYFGAIIQYGFRITATKKIALKRDNLTEVSEIFSTVISASVILSLVCSIIFLFIVFAVDIFNQHFQLYFFTLLFLVFQNLFPIWFFQGMEKMKFIAFINFSNKLFYLLALFYFVKDHDDYNLVPLLSAVSALISLVIAFIVIKRHFHIQFKRPKTYKIKRLLIEGRHAFIGQLAPNLYNNSSLFLLGLFTNNVIVGQYTAAIRVIEAIMSACNILTSTFLPFLVRNIDKHQYFARLMLLLGVTLSVGCFFSAELIVQLLYSFEGKSVSTTIAYLSPRILFIFIVNTYGVNYLMIMGHERIYKNIVLYSSIISFFIACLVIPIFSLHGAVGVLLGASFLMSILCYLNFLKYKQEAAGA